MVREKKCMTKPQDFKVGGPKEVSIPGVAERGVVVPSSDWGPVCLSCLKGGLTVPAVAVVSEFGLTTQPLKKPEIQIFT